MKPTTDRLAEPDKAACIRVLPEAPPKPAPSSGRVWLGLLWCEWYGHSRLLLFFLLGWLAAVWTLPLVVNPGWILAFGLIYALLAGPMMGGGDAIEGCEEFALALPPTRAERYWARLLIGGGALLLFTVLDLAVLGLDLVQAIVRFYLDTGVIRPMEVLKPRLLYGIVLAFPFAVFAVGFALAANARSRTLVFTGWFWAGLVAMAVLKLGLSYEHRNWGVGTGLTACTGLFFVGTIALWIGYRLYCRKEIVNTSSPLVLPTYWGLWLLLFVSALVVTLFLGSSLWQELLRLVKP